jgi:hypothetical protein
LIARHNGGGESRGACPDNHHVGSPVKMNSGRAWFCALLAGQRGGAGAEGSALLQKVSSIHNGTFLLHIPSLLLNSIASIGSVYDIAAVGS